MTPAPSEVPQLSTVKWGQSKIVASMPVHCTLSIAKELVSKVPKWEFLVGVPSGYPNILQRYFLGIAITRQEIKCFTQVNFQFYPKKCVHRNIFGKQLRIQDVLFTYFEQVVSLFANFYSNTKSLQSFCAKSSLISANFTERVICQIPSLVITTHCCYLIIWTSGHLHWKDPVSGQVRSGLVKNAMFFKRPFHLAKSVTMLLLTRKDW